MEEWDELDKWEAARDKDPEELCRKFGFCWRIKKKAYDYLFFKEWKTKRVSPRVFGVHWKEIFENREEIQKKYLGGQWEIKRGGVYYKRWIISKESEDYGYISRRLRFLFSDSDHREQKEAGIKVAARFFTYAWREKKKVGKGKKIGDVKALKFFAPLLLEILSRIERNELHEGDRVEELPAAFGFMAVRIFEGMPFPPLLRVEGGNAVVNKITYGNRVFLLGYLFSESIPNRRLGRVFLLKLKNLFLNKELGEEGIEKLIDLFRRSVVCDDDDLFTDEEVELLEKIVF